MRARKTRAGPEADRDAQSAYVDHRCTNAILEGLNGIIRHIKTRARGLRDMGYFSTMIHPIRGKLDLATVTI